MNYSAIFHRNASVDCYALNSDEVKISLRTGKDVTSVNIIHNDPFVDFTAEDRKWFGFPSACVCEYSLPYNNIWSITIRPQFKRIQYYFEITAGCEKVYYFQDGFHKESELKEKDNFVFFKMAWLNESDVIQVPSWVEKTIWYQIFPERFCSADSHQKRLKNKEWGDDKTMSWHDFYGGDLRGIISRLDYLSDLGITGIYLTPVFESTTDHKYNTIDYTKIDPDFGTEADMIELVEKAHLLGIRVMLDAVFNHSGTGFVPWQDVIKNGEKSRYRDWFFINKFPVDNGSWFTEDGRYFSFSFTAGMPKLNTNNNEVAEYFTNICKHWTSEWKIDGIRFDVGDEIAHSFIKKLRRELKFLNKDIFLLGEIWIDAVQWLQGDEYDSVMNYPFKKATDCFWGNKNETTYALRQKLDSVYSLYAEQTERTLFNFLDTHDTVRAILTAGNNDVLFQKLAFMFSLQGSVCLYYGTEIALCGTSEEYNRTCMPWNKIDAGEYADIFKETKKLIALRKTYPQLYSSKLKWITEHENTHPRLIHIRKYAQRTDETAYIDIYLNAGSCVKIELPSDFCIIYSRLFADGILKNGGILFVKISAHNLQSVPKEAE